MNVKLVVVAILWALICGSVTYVIADRESGDPEQSCPTLHVGQCGRCVTTPGGTRCVHCVINL